MLASGGHDFRAGLSCQAGDRGPDAGRPADHRDLLTLERSPGYRHAYHSMAWAVISCIGVTVAHQHRQIVPGIVDDLIPAEVARMVCHHFVAKKNHDACGVRPHQHHPTSRPRVDAVAIMVGHDQAGRRGPDGLFDKSVEWPAQFHQARPLFLENLPDRPVLELRMLVALGVSDALICQPSIQLRQARDARLGSEHLIAQIADLVLDLSLLPT